MIRNNRKCNCMNNEVVNETVIENTVTEEFTNYYEKDYDMCSCGFEEEANMFPTNLSLGQSYVPYQQMDKTFKPCIGLKMGTIFPELVSPYMPCQSMAQAQYLRVISSMEEGCNK